MSLPVFLEPSPYSKMPNGSNNEWSHYFEDCGYSLEANAFIPLFWLLLFSKNNILKARFVDEYDVDDDNTQIERLEAIEDFGEQTYPYFVVSKEEGLQNLRKRKHHFLQIFGSEFETAYSHFEHIIEHEFQQNYILLRTSGLGDVDEQTTPVFLEQVSVYQNLENENLEQNSEFWEVSKKIMSTYQDNPNYYLMGASSSGNQKLEINISNSKIPNSTKQAKDLSETKLWLMSLIIAAPAIFVYLTTKSVWYCVLTFVVFSIIISLVMFKISKK